MLNRIAHAASRSFAGGLLDNERHAKGVVVEEQSVPLLAMIAEAFAVIGEEDDRGLIVELSVISQR
jgi:hypothetical protein